MPFNSNFNPVQFVTPEGVQVTGTSEGPEGGELVFRGVALQQEAHLVHGDASLSHDWRTRRALLGVRGGGGEREAVRDRARHRDVPDDEPEPAEPGLRDLLMGATRGAALNAHHGASPRGLSAAGAARSARGRFGRMFGYLPVRDADVDALRALAVTMTTGIGRSRGIPAGFTYLAQFIDHDLTFDPTSQLDRDNDPEALINFRTPRLDLDSVYGSGPRDRPYLYDADDPAKLLVGRRPGAPEDLPRNEQDRALIGDPRNDEHLIIAQLHLLFLRFHNAVVDHLRAEDGPEGAALFAEAQRLVRWHFQWIVLHEFLDTIIGAALARAVRAERRFYRWDTAPFMPVEFSAAAFRFGHSMVRPDYRPNTGVNAAPILPLTGTDEEVHLGGLRPLPTALVIEWDRFFRRPGRDAPQLARAIDREVTPALHALPRVLRTEEPSLPLLNLLRGRALGLPSGLDVARAMGEPELTREALALEAFPTLADAPPLWYYVLSEAQERGDSGDRLGPVGGRIVGEVLVGLVEGDPSSYRRQWPHWTPTLGDGPGFTMADLIKFTEDAAPGDTPGTP